MSVTLTVIIQHVGNAIEKSFSVVFRNAQRTRDFIRFFKRKSRLSLTKNIGILLNQSDSTGAEPFIHFRDLRRPHKVFAEH